MIRKEYHQLYSARNWMFVSFPHKQPIFAIFAWLKKEVGGEQHDWAYNGVSGFYFKNEEDKVKFILRWL